MKKAISLLAVGTISLAAGSALADNPITTFDGHYYQVVNSSGIDWLTAEQDALTMSYNGLTGHLATITSGDEDVAVGNAVAGETGTGPTEFWLGGFQNPKTETDPTAGWTWVNNEGTFPGINTTSGFDNNYSNWNSGEPNDYYGAGSEQYLGINLGQLGGFNDEGSLGLIGGYVVEFDPNTIPGGGLPNGFVPDAASTSAMLLGSMTLMGLVARRFRK